jgi:hypothetical protein
VFAHCARKCCSILIFNGLNLDCWQHCLAQLSEVNSVAVHQPIAVDTIEYSNHSINQSALPIFAIPCRRTENPLLLPHLEDTVQRIRAGLCVTRDVLPA